MSSSPPRDLNAAVSLMRWSGISFLTFMTFARLGVTPRDSR